MLHDIDVDAVHAVRFERVDAAPVGTLVYHGWIPTEGGIFRQDDELRVGGDDRLVSDLRVATATGIVVEDVDAIGVLQEFVAEGAATEDIRLAGSAIIDFEQNSGGRGARNNRLYLSYLLLELLYQSSSGILSKGELSYEQNLLK